MKSTTAAARYRAAVDAPRIDLLKKLPYRQGQLKLSDIKKRSTPLSARAMEWHRKTLIGRLPDSAPKIQTLSLIFDGGVTVNALPLPREIACLMTKSISSSVMPE
jgi:hypothetical protein